MVKCEVLKLNIFNSLLTQILLFSKKKEFVQIKFSFILLDSFFLILKTFVFEKNIQKQKKIDKFCSRFYFFWKELRIIQQVHKNNLTWERSFSSEKRERIERKKSAKTSISILFLLAMYLNPQLYYVALQLNWCLLFKERLLNNLLNYRIML